MERFLRSCPSRLLSGGFLAMEFGAGQEAVLREIAVSVGLQDVTIRPDLQGKSRFLLAVAP